MAEVIMPKMGDAMEEGTLVSWHKGDGDTVRAGEVIGEIETDKSNVEIEAEEDGVLHIQAQPGAVVPVGNVIAVIGDAAPKANGANGAAAGAATNGASSPRPAAGGARTPPTTRTSRRWPPPSTATSRPAGPRT
jgi:pyruvate dehydrogenase E2 component (dihydrolipoamide acetyltransferase)